MSKYDVYTMTEGEGLLLDVQAELLDALKTRVVVPLLPKKLAPKPARRLNPIFEIDGNSYVMVTQFLAAVLSDGFEPVSVRTVTLSLMAHKAGATRRERRFG